MLRDIALESGRCAEEPAPVGVPGRPRLSIQFQGLVKGRGDAVVSIEVVGPGVAVGEGRVDTHPRNERHGFEEAVRVPTALRGTGHRESRVVQEVGVNRAVSVVEEVAEGPEVKADVGIVTDIRHGRIDPSGLGCILRRTRQREQTQEKD